jgi:hypothetical protein
VSELSSRPLISEALDCGTAKNIGGITQGKGTRDLERFTVDNALFPDAVCNDGSPAIFYFRPAANAANANKWVIMQVRENRSRTSIKRPK